MPTQPLEGDVRTQLAKILASDTFQSAGRGGKLLAFLVEHAIDGRADELKEYTLGAEALGRGDAFDPRSDSIARVEASRLRGKLDLYYATEGRTDPLRIHLVKGSYIPQFEATVPTPASLPSRTWRFAALTAFVVATLSVLAAIWIWRATPRLASEAPLRLEVNLGQAAILQSTQVGSSSVIISPAGDRLVFVSFRDGVPRLMTKPLTEDAPAVEIAGTEGARGPFFSPSGEWVAFQAGGKLKKVQWKGGPPVPLCDCLELLGGSWGDDDVIVAMVDAQGLVRIPAAGGKLTHIDDLETFALWPQVLPGSQAILFTTGRPVAEAQSVAVYSRITKKVTPLVSGSYGRYLESGHLAYVDHGTLFAVPFDAERLKITGARVALVTGVAYMPGFGSAEFDVSRNGHLVYRRAADQGRSIMAWLDPTGAVTPALPTPAAYLWPRLSPDASKIVYALGDRDEQSLRVLDFASGRTTQVLFGDGVSGAAVWTQDGRYLITQSGGGGLQWLSADGAGKPKLLSKANDVMIPWSLTRDNNRLAVYRRGIDARGSVTFDLWTVPLEYDGHSLTARDPEPLVISDSFETYPEFSPDGRWIAYTALEGGSYEVYVRAFPGNGRKWQVSNHGGRHARWLRDGRLLYSSPDHHIMEVRYRTSGSEFEAATPRLWREQPLADTTIFPDFDVAFDGRVLALVPPPSTSEQQDAHHVTVLLNAFEEIKQGASNHPR